MKENFAKDINVPTKITILGVFNFRAFLNLAMLLFPKKEAVLKEGRLCSYTGY